MVSGTIAKRTRSIQRIVNFIALDHDILIDLLADKTELPRTNGMPPRKRARFLRERCPWRPSPDSSAGNCQRA